ncbi:carbamoyltransferase C-terminal domain-containing protein [Sphaerisporangium sp. TRM90804]|uniref:carbamoyltransferase family protein n=1 Tax=Sphaerisporangium sp. TRM90804 TaxID=3031113 RepID=UPI00244A867B|nr:carbamoyltransferase C-terminal domain-containing protein [Sphaerisporangium sp. TRM90804]MDH2426672.1 carbamoyltransferase C-terminal domain-containing protein [Sphaerisporangium sp. TRM90804]
MRFLGINAIFHDPAAALVVDGEVVAAAEEERFSRRKHGKRPVPFSAWELPELAAAWCLRQAGLRPEDLDGVAYSYDPDLVAPGAGDPGPRRPSGRAGARSWDLPARDTAPDWEELRTTYARRAPAFLATALPGLDTAQVRYVPHHVAHAASAGLAAPYRDSAVLVCDGRGEAVSHLAGHYRGGDLTVLAAQELPHSLGLMYEELTEHLGFLRSSDEYKVMALASYGEPRHLGALRELIYTTGDGGFRVEPIDWSGYAKALGRGDTEADERDGAPAGGGGLAHGGTLTSDHADLAASVQARLEEVLLELASWLHGRTGERYLTMAGGVALNCVANTRLLAEGPFEDIWVQPAAGDAGTALGGALYLAHLYGEPVAPMTGADLGREWTEEELGAWLTGARLPFRRPRDLAGAVAEDLAADRIVAWFQGRSEYGPRALGRRSLLAHPGRAANTERLNAVKGREPFRPIAPMVLADRAHEIFTRGPLPSPYMLFVHDVRPEWRDRIPAVVHTDGTARVQTVDRAAEPLLAGLLDAFEARTGLPVVVNTSLNTAGRPMVDDPRDALECFGSAPVDVLVLGPYIVRRGEVGAS